VAAGALSQIECRISNIEYRKSNIAFLFGEKTVLLHPKNRAIIGVLKL
jgi:hypothetical protein